MRHINRSLRISGILSSCVAMSSCALIIGADWDEYSSGEVASKTCTPRAMETCYDGPPDTINHGACRAGAKTCNPEGTGYTNCVGQILPKTEDCQTAEDEDCDGSGTNGCVYQSCSAIPPRSSSGVYSIDLDRDGPMDPTDLFCDVDADNERWALVYNSVGKVAESERDSTLVFWNIPYAERLLAKGVPSIEDNFYFGALYLFGREYRDEVEDLDGKAVEVMRAEANSIDKDTMRFIDPMRIVANQKQMSAGSEEVSRRQFASGWSSPDYDGDLLDGGNNCALNFGNVTQHYAVCMIYNLGADGESPIDDFGWGPHVHELVMGAFSLRSDDDDPDVQVFSRVKRISRWTRW
ncbi:hypothetical protein WMF01_54415 [Sorangium sp. So ce1667]